MRAVVAVVMAAPALLAGCATAPPLVRMEAAPAPGQDVLYRGGVPVFSSSGERGQVILSPVTGPTGRYELEERLAFMVRIANRGAARLEVSEASFEATANGAHAPVVTAAELEDEVRTSAAWARAGEAFQAFAAGLDAGVGVLSVAASRDARTASARAGGTIASASEAAAVTREELAAIEREEDDARAGLLGALQRTSLAPGEAVEGFVVFRVPRFDACGRQDARGRQFHSSGPCRLDLRVDVGGELHRFRLAEALQ